MTLPRILSAVGRTLAVLGVVMLLFMAFQLWGTGLQQAQAQEGLEDDLAERLRQVTAAGQSAPAPIAARAASDPQPGEEQPGKEQPGEEQPGTGGDGGNTPAATAEATPAAAAEATPAADDPADAPPQAASAEVPPDPASLPEDPVRPQVVRRISEPASARAVARLLEPEVEELLPLVYPNAGEAIARLLIPAIDVDAVVVADVQIDDLRKGPGHYSTTPLPGQPGNAAIAGHRTTYGAPFGRIAELAPNDEIIVETLQGRFVYRVLAGSAVAGRSLGHRVVAPTALEVLEDHGDNRLTLTSCHPKYSARERIIVQAVLVGDPVVRLPRPGEPIGAEHVQPALPGEPPPGSADGAETPDAAATGESDTPGPGRDDRPQVTPGEDAGDAPDGDTAAPQAPEDPTVLADPVAPSDGAGADAPSEGADAGEPNEGADAGAPPEGAPPSTVAARGTDPAPPPAAPVTTEGFGEGLSGDRGAIGPAVLWGLAAGAVWALGWALGRSGRRLRACALAAVPFLVVLYITFSYIDRALPSY